MTNEPFAHLLVHSEYSINDSIVRIERLVKAAAERNINALALTDTNNLFGMVKFYESCRKLGIKPIIGIELSVYDPDTPASRLIALAATDAGYRNLILLSSRVYRNESNFGRVERSWLNEIGDGLLLIGGGQRSDIGRMLLSGDIVKAQERAAWYRLHFKDRFFLALSRTGRENEEAFIQKALIFADQESVPLVGVNDVCLVDSTDHAFHGAKVCITSKSTLDTGEWHHLYSDQQFLRSAEEMNALFADIPDAVENANEIAMRCNVRLQLDANFLPSVKIAEGETQNTVLRKSAEDGLRNYLQDRGSDEHSNSDDVYHERLEHELQTIIRMDFAGYFLIVDEIINWTRSQKIAVGVRGSGNGSLVAFVLGITTLDPIEHELVFERLLNPHRVSMPDFDIDICMLRRQEVIEHVAHEYGKESVGQIVTFGTLAAKAAIRDVTRVLALPYPLGQELVDLIPDQLNITIAEARELEPEIDARVKRDENVESIMEYATALEGLARNVGRHAGGVVIAPGNLHDFAPFFTESSDGDPITQFDKKDVAKIGLIKFDLLGLKTLTIIDLTVQAINKERREQGLPEIDIDSIPLNDPATYKMIQTGDTVAVFQLESPGMRNLIKDLRPDRLEDLIALVALYRPGPLRARLDKRFIDRKHKPELREETPALLRDVLSKTYGVMIYQEDAMNIVQTMAGFSLGEADILRKSMADKDKATMESLRQRFMDGAEARGIELGLVTDTFQEMEGFAEYSFNRSHAAGYAIVAYQTAWLKAHYGHHFMAALLSIEIDDIKRVKLLFNEATRMGIELRPPNINVGVRDFVTSENGIEWGLRAIKGVGHEPISALQEARANGPFKSVLDVCRRVDTRKVTKRVLENLAKAGALDCFALENESILECRARFLAEIEVAIRTAEQDKERRDTGQSDLFGDVADVDELAVELKFQPLTKSELIEHESITLGLRLSEKDIESYREEFRKLGFVDLAGLPEESADVRILCRITEQSDRRTSQGKKMVVGSVFDGNVTVGFSVFDNDFENCKDNLGDDELVVLEGTTYTKNNGDISLTVHQMYSIDQARHKYKAVIVLDCAEEQTTGDFLYELKGLLKPGRGKGQPPRLRYRLNGHVAEVEFSKGWRVAATIEVLDSLYQRMGEQNVHVVYPN